MTTPARPIIRLVGGPPVLDGSRWDLRAADGEIEPAGTAEHFTRAVRGTRACSLGELRADCRDRDTAEALAQAWRVARYTRAGRTRRWRPQLFRFAGTFALDATRDGHGGWTVVPGARRDRPLAIATPGEPSSAPSPAGSTVAVAGTAIPDWTELEARLDRATATFWTVADLLPDGPLADRAGDARRAVTASIADATRLGAVGAAVVPTPRAAPDELDELDRAGAARALADRIDEVIARIDEATFELVALHLRLDHAERVEQRAGAAGETIRLVTDALAELDQERR